MGKSQIEKKPGIKTLKTMDDLFGLENNSNDYISIEIDKLIPYEKHPFELYTGERRDDMVESIRAHGVLVPILVRPHKVDSKKYEILAGHNRWNCSIIAEKDTVPCNVMNISDEEAIVYVIETNLMQRSFSDMSHSEKAAVIALHHTKMFSQGKRNDIINHLRQLEEIPDSEENYTFSQIAKKLNTVKEIGDTYSLSKDTVARYLRIHKLIPEIKRLLDDGNIPFIPAVTISYLTESEQLLLAECVEEHPVSVDIKKAKILREYSKEGKLKSLNKIMQILNGTLNTKPEKIPDIKISKALYTKYFRPEQSAMEIDNILNMALEEYFNKRNQK